MSGRARLGRECLEVEPPKLSPPEEAIGRHRHPLGDERGQRVVELNERGSTGEIHGHADVVAPDETALGTASGTPPRAELTGIWKSFGATQALSDVSLRLLSGEVHGLVGENGAGKSTLVKMLYGVYDPDEGEVLIKGESLRMKSPRDAITRGVGMVFQHFQLVDVFSVAENVVLSRCAHTATALPPASSAPA